MATIHLRRCQYPVARCSSPSFFYSIIGAFKDFWSNNVGFSWLTDVDMLLVEATLANPTTAWTLWTMCYNFAQISFIVRVLLLFDALDAKTFDASSLHHDQAVTVFGVLQNIIAEVSGFGALVDWLLGNYTPGRLHHRFKSQLRLVNLDWWMNRRFEINERCTETLGRKLKKNKETRKSH